MTPLLFADIAHPADVRCQRHPRCRGGRRDAAAGGDRRHRPGVHPAVHRRCTRGQELGPLLPSGTGEGCGSTAAPTIVTDRMLEMFKPRAAPPKAVAGQGTSGATKGRQLAMLFGDAEVALTAPVPGLDDYVN